MDIYDCPSGINADFDMREAIAAFAKESKKAASEARGCDFDSDFKRGYEQCERDVIKALRGHKQSMLWGQYGLIAATMRCVDAIAESENITPKPQ